MADNYLITGYWGEPHVTAENDRGINAAMFGTGRFVLPVGQQLRAEYIGNNTIRMYDGKLMNNGAAAGIPAGEYVDLLIANAGQGMKRNDLIVFQYSQDASTLIESGVFTVVQGTETSGTAADPSLRQADLLSGNAAFDQMALWRVSVSGTAISAPVSVFSNWGGYAPGGYGLGSMGRICNDANKAINSGFYSLSGVSCDNVPQSQSLNYGTMIVAKRYNYIVQEVTFRQYSIKRNSEAGGVTWAEWEWVNPPMIPGVAYRTTERWNGKAVYTKSINAGALPNASSADISIGVHANNIIDFRAIKRYSAYTEPFPSFRTVDGAAEGTLYFFSNYMTIRTFTDNSSYTLEVVIKYTE